MFPLVQMQPCAMPRPTNLEPYYPFHSNSGSVEPHPRSYDSTLPFPRAFPIRTSQSYRRAAQFSSSPYPPRSENHMRRKAPTGTLDAAYDESSNPPALAPPPPRHMVTPRGSGAGSYPPSGTQFHQPLQGAWTTGSRISTHSGHVGPNAAPWVFNNESLWQHMPQQGGTGGLHSYQPPQFGNAGSFPNIYQPVIRANEYNVRAFCPPPMPNSETLPFGQAAWQPGHALGGYHCAGQFPAILSNPLMTGKHLVNVDPSGGRPQPAGQTSTRLEYACKTRQSPHLNIEGLTLDPGRRPSIPGHLPAPTVQLGFREKALAHAHKVYMDLLAHVQSVRQSQQSRTGSRSQGSSKSFVYPKPPNPVSVTAFGEAGVSRAYPSTHRANSGNSNGQIGPNRGYVLDHAGHQMHPPPVFSAQPGTSFGVDPHQGPDSSSPFGPLHVEHPEDLHTDGLFHPVTNARSSLEVLSTLCEQSGWKWVDGILLGGCLHYGLEDYETALQWFTRVVACDSR